MTSEGFVRTGFEPVKIAFDTVLADSPHAGAAFAAMRDGDMVVDVWGGFADASTGRRWARDTVAPVLSCTKALSTTCLLLLEDQGLIDLDAPISRYWPAFEASGKAAVRIIDALTHRSGVPGLTAPTDWAEVMDGRTMADRTAAQAPTVPIGAITYHPATVGWICGELVLRSHGRSIGRFFAEQIARPLALDAWIGLPGFVVPRTARLGTAAGWGDVSPFLIGRTDDARIRMIWANPPLFASEPFEWNRPDVLATEIPALNGVASARSLAALFDALLRGRSPMPRGLGSRITASRVAGQDLLLGGDRAYGLGFELQTDQLTLGPDKHAFGQTGAGGAIVGAWPSTRVAFAFVPASLRDVPRDDRRDRLLDALGGCVS